MFRYDNDMSRIISLVATVIMDGKLKGKVWVFFWYQWFTPNLGTELVSLLPVGEGIVVNFFQTKLLCIADFFIDTLFFYRIPLLYGVLQYFPCNGVILSFIRIALFVSIWGGAWAGAVSVAGAVDAEDFPRSSRILLWFSYLQSCLLQIHLGILQELSERDFFIWPRFFLHPHCEDALLWPSSCGKNSVMETNTFPSVPLC